MDNELKDLISRFNAVQREDDQAASKRLNDRNVVEIIAMLQRRKALDLVYTVDGREYLTWPQLRREVRDEVHVRGGRMDLCDLPTALGVDLSSIERAVAEVAAEDPSFMVHEGEIFTDSFYDAVVDQINASLRAVGHQSIADLSRAVRLSFAFTAAMLRKFVDNGRVVNAVLDDEAAYTDQFVASQERRLFAALLAATTPVRIADVAKRRNVYQPLLNTAVQRLIAAQMLPGRVDGGTYVPSAFEASRNAAVSSFYLSNGFIPYATASSNGVANPKVFLQELFNGVSGASTAAGASNSTGGKSSRGGRGAGGRGRGASVAKAAASEVGSDVGASDKFPNFGHALSTGFVSDRLLRNIEPHLDAVLSGEALTVDLSDYFPPFVSSDADRQILVARLINLFPSLTEQCDAVGTSTFVRKVAWDGVAKSIDAVAREEVTRDKKAAAFTTPDDPKSVNRKVLLLVSRALKMQEDATEGSALHGLLELWAPRIELAFSTARAEAARRGDVGAAQLSEWCIAEGRNHWSALQFATRAVEAITSRQAELGGEATVVLIVKHCVATHAVPLVKLAFVERCAEVANLRSKLAPCVGRGDPTPAANPSTSLQQMIAMIPKEESAVFIEMTKCVTAHAQLPPVQQMQAICKSLEDCSAENGIRFPLHGLNKKVERQALRNAREALEASALKNASMAAEGGAALTSDGVADAFQLLCAHGLSQALGVVVPLPGKALAPIASFIAACNPAVGPAFLAAHKAVVEAILHKDDTAKVAVAAAAVTEARRAAQEAAAGKSSTAE